MRAALTRRAQRQRAMLHRIGGIADDQQH
jgi:hypothetical protein